MTVSKSGNAYRYGSVYGNSQTESCSGGDHSHSTGTGGGNYVTGFGDHPCIGDTNNVKTISVGGGGHSHSMTFTPSITDGIGVTDNISVSLGDGDIETRPDNFTYRVWKRIS